MKSFLLILIPVLSFGATLTSCNKTVTETERLTTLGKVWGFLKYYHPEVGSGAMNWDSVLVAAIPNVISAESTDAYNDELLKLIDTAGEIEACNNNCISVSGDSLVNLIDFSWMDNGLLSAEVSEKLKYIRDNKQPFGNYYVQPSNLDDADFPNEESYSSMQSPDVNYRLLALFRYWNIIEYYYPYKELTDKPWDEILTIYIPVFLAESDGFGYYENMTRLINEIGDGHILVYHQEYTNRIYKNFQASVLLDKIDGRIVVTGFRPDSLGALTGLRIGDIITHVESLPIQERYNFLEPYTPFSTKAQKERDILRSLLRGNRTELQVSVERSGQPLEMSIPVYHPRDVAGNDQNSEETAWKRINERTGYVNLLLLTDNKKVEEVFDSLMDTEVLILDLRNYPPFMPFFEFISHLFPGPKYPPLAQFVLPYFDMPGYFIKRGMNNELHTDVLVPVKDEVYGGKIILLVNQWTQSRGEFFAAILQNYPNILTVGSQTAGADGNVTDVWLPGGIYCRFTGMGSNYPNGIIKQRKGVNIDVEVKPTIEGVREGRDEVLDKAINISTEQMINKF